MVEPKNYRIKSFVRERDFLANNFKNSYGYYLLDKPLYKEEIILSSKYNWCGGRRLLL